MTNLVRLWQPQGGTFRPTEIYFPADDPSHFKTRANAHFVSRGFIPYLADQDPNQGATAISLSPEVLALPNPLELEKELKETEKAQKKTTQRKSKKVPEASETPPKPLVKAIKSNSTIGELFKLLGSSEGASIESISATLKRPVTSEMIKTFVQSQGYTLEIKGNSFRVLGEIQWS